MEGELNLAGAALNPDSASSIQADGSGNVNLDGLSVQFGGNARFPADRSSPTVTVGSSAGSGASARVTGGNVCGTLVLMTGTSPDVSQILATLSIGTGIYFNPVVFLYPQNTAAAALRGTAQDVYASANTGGFTLEPGSSPLAANTRYCWYYLLIGSD